MSRKLFTISRIISAFYANSKEPKLRKVLILGLDHSGKTTIWYRLKFSSSANPPSPRQLEDMVSTSSPIGFQVETIKFSKHKVNIWDINGSGEDHKQYLHLCDGVLFVVDSTDPERFEEAKERLDSLLRNRELKNTKIMVLAHKQDLPQAIPFEEFQRKFPIDELQLNATSSEIRREAELNLLPSSAYNGLGVSEGLEWLLKKDCPSLSPSPKRSDEQ